MIGQYKVLNIIIVILLCICGSILSAESGIIFQDNFDNQKDWSPLQKTGGDSNATSSTDPSQLPDGYNYFTMDGSAYSNKGKNTLNINSSQYRGASGKAFIFYTEMDRNCGAWCNDGLLGIQLPGGETGYKEIYIRFYIKFMKNYRWNYGSDVGLKMLHVAHHKRGDSKNAFFSYTQNKPRNFFKIYHYNNDRGSSGVMGNPTYSIYTGDSNPKYRGSSSNLHGYFPGATWGGGTTFHDDASKYRSTLSGKYGAETIVTDQNTNYPQYKAKDFPYGMVGDGEWHCWEWRMKMNSSSGNADGICEFWQDGIKVYGAYDIQWVASGSVSSRQWNYLWLGGNNNNTYSSSGEEEQWYAVDDLVVSTTQIGMGDVEEPVLKVPSIPGVPQLKE